MNQAPHFPTRYGYLTQITQQKYIALAIKQGVLPQDAATRKDITSLRAPSDPDVPIQFWQLNSLLGHDPIIEIVADFYERVFAQDDWFSSVFARVGNVNHHINTQASMWVDVMGGGPYYHGAEYRLSFHHHHNAQELMDAKGAALWVSLMKQALDAQIQAPRIRNSFNTFLAHFLQKYADEFGFINTQSFGPTNPPQVG